MPAFIVLNLTLSFLVQTQSRYQAIFIAPTMLYIGLATIAISLITALSRKVPYTIWYDSLASGILLTWFCYWHLFFRNDLPMFYLFPLFFAFMTALVSIFFVSKRDRFDQESIEHLRFFSELELFHPALIIAAVLVSVLLPGHYLLFPVLMNVLIVRYTLTSCLDIK